MPAESLIITFLVLSVFAFFMVLVAYVDVTEGRRSTSLAHSFRRPQRDGATSHD